MPGGNSGFQGFFVKADSVSRKAGGEGPGGQARPEVGNANIGTENRVGGGAGEVDGIAGFAPARKKRGRPANATSPAPAPEPQLVLTSDDDKDREARKLAKLRAESVKNNHLMLAYVIGLPELQLSDEEAESLALALICVEQEWPVFKFARKWSVLLALAAVGSKTYVPRVAHFGRRVAAAKQTKRTPFNVPAVNPAMAREDAVAAAKVNGKGPEPAAVVARGDELIFPTGAPDGGKIKFN